MGQDALTYSLKEVEAEWITKGNYSKWRLGFTLTLREKLDAPLKEVLKFEFQEKQQRSK